MKNNTIRTVFVGLLMLSCFAVATNAQDVDKLVFPKLNELRTPPVEKVTLPNGMRLYLLEDRSLPLFNVRVRVNCGGYLEPADKIGLAGICGSVMRTGGTAKWTGDEIDAMLEGIGGSVETGIDLVAAGAGINVLSEYTDTGLEVLAEVLRRPVFDEDKIDLAKVQARSTISRRNDEPGDLARQEYRKLIYGKDSPYARHAEYATIDAISRDDLIAFHKSYFHPENIQMAVWGDFDKDEIIRKIESWFADWQPGNIAVPEPPEVEYQFRSQVYYVEKPDAQQSYIRVGHIGGLVSDEDYADRIVMNSILGGGFGSRLLDAVRTRLGLAYSVGGRFISNYTYPGYFFAVASTKPQSTIQAAREMITQIKSMQTDLPTEEEMQKGKDGYLNSFVFNFDNRREVVNRLMTYDFFGMPEDFLQQEKERVEDVTPEDVMEAARRNLRPEEMIVLVVGNAADFDEPLEALGLGTAETIDITIPSGEPKSELTISDETLARGKTLFDRAVEFAGGIDNLKSIKSLAVKGVLALVTPQGEIPISVESIHVYPDKSRTVFNMMGQNQYNIYNVDAGWKTDMTGGVVPKTEQDLADDRIEMARNTIRLLATADNLPYRVVYDGAGELEGKALDYAVVVDADGNRICRLGFESATGELACKSYWGESPFGEGNITEMYVERASYNNVRIANVTTFSLDGRKYATLNLNEIVVNGEVSAGAFDKPE